MGDLASVFIHRASVLSPISGQGCRIIPHKNGTGKRCDVWRYSGDSGRTDTHHPAFCVYRQKDCTPILSVLQWRLRRFGRGLESGSHHYRVSSAAPIGTGLFKRRILFAEGTDIESKALDPSGSFGHRDLFDCHWSLCTVGCAKHPRRGSAGTRRSAHSHAEAHTAGNAYASGDCYCHPHPGTYIHSKPGHADSTC
jgi:hypothetical protein